MKSSFLMGGTALVEFAVRPAHGVGHRHSTILFHGAPVQRGGHRAHALARAYPTQLSL